MRSDSSAARAMVQRQGIGGVRHWQRQERDKVLSISAVYTFRAELHRCWDKEFDKEETLQFALHDKGD